VGPEKLSILFNSEHLVRRDFVLQCETTGEHEATYRSEDLAPALIHLVDAVVLGEVTISGNVHAVVFNYATEVGQFEIAVPTVDEWSLPEGEGLFRALKIG